VLVCRLGVGPAGAETQSAGEPEGAAAEGAGAVFIKKQRRKPSRAVGQSPFETKSSALGELAAATCFVQAVLLTFNHTRVAGQQAVTAQADFRGWVSFDQRAADAENAGADLTGGAATLDVDEDVVLLAGLAHIERNLQELTEPFEGEVVSDLLVVDGDFARTGREANSCHRGFTAAEAPDILLGGHTVTTPDASRLQASFKGRADCTDPLAASRGC
jgi:hypothetical protein